MMNKNEVTNHYGIMKHIKGDFYDNDCLVLGPDYRPLKYIYRASADYMCSELNRAHSGRQSYYVVRCD